MNTNQGVSIAALALGVSLALGGCNSGSSGDGATGVLTVGITDAPIDESTIQEVVVTVTGLDVKPKEGERITLPITPQTLVLTDLQDGLRELLVDQAQVPAGDYVWARLYLDADIDQDATDSYVKETGAVVELYVPSNANTGLKINTPFRVDGGQNQDLTIDFDLRKSLHMPDNEGYYVLRPTLRLVKTAESASLTGTVSSTLLNDLNCEFNGDGIATSAAVYVFEGTGVTPDDVDKVDPNPLASAKVKYKDKPTTDYRYEVAYLPPGGYTVALTCEANKDDPDVDESVSADPIDFYGAADVTVEMGVDTMHDFN